MSTPPGLADAAHCALLVVDVQEKFRPVIEDFDELAASCTRLVRVFRLLRLPVLATEQYPRGLGLTVEPLRSELVAAAPSGDVPDKSAFSAFGCDAVREELNALGTRSVVVCGIEAHVCVSQTVHDLLDAAYATYVAVDAVRSRDMRRRDGRLALRRAAARGAVLSTSEALAFELMRDARHPAFTDVQRLFLEA